MATIEMLRVYDITMSFCNLSVHDPDHGQDETWLYDDWNEAAARMKRCLDEHPKADLCLSTRLMTPGEFAALPPDED